MSVKGRILYAEDHDDTRVMMEYMLTSAGFEVVAVATGEEAYKLVRQGGFDLFLTDHTLPDSSGAAICAAVREFDVDTPILFYSARAFPAEIDQAMKAGANAYLVKPQDLLSVAGHVEKLIEEAAAKRRR